MRIQIGDLVKFKYDMFENEGPVHLVTKAWISKDGDGRDRFSGHIVLHRGDDIQHRAHNFIVISREKS